MTESVDPSGGAATPQPTKLQGSKNGTGSIQTSTVSGISSSATAGPPPNLLPNHQQQQSNSRELLKRHLSPNYHVLSNDVVLSVLTERLASTTNLERQISDLQASTTRLESQLSNEKNNLGVHAQSIAALQAKMLSDKEHAAAQVTAALQRQQAAEEAEQRATKLVASALRLCKELPKKPTERVHELEEQVEKQRKTIQQQSSEAAMLKDRLTKAESKVKTLEQKVANRLSTDPAQADIIQVVK